LLARFDVSTGDATTKLTQFNKTIAGVKAGLGGLAGSLFGAFAVNKVANFIKGQLDLSDAVVDTASKLGVSTDELQKFQYGAGLVGVEAESAAQALGFLNKNFGEALAGGKEQAETFQKLGVSLKGADGQVRQIGDVIPELSDAFAKMGSQQERTAAATKIFGKSGAQLLPLLQEGSASLAKMNEEFTALGGGLESDFLDAADKAGDAVYRFDFAMKGLKSRIALAVLPTLADWATKLSKGVAWLNKLTKETYIVKEAWALMGVIASAAALKTAIGIGKMLRILPKGAGFWRSVLGLGVWGLVIAAAVGLALVFEDLWVGLQGGQSLIKDWLNETMGVEATTALFENLKETFSAVGDAFKELGPVFKDIGGDLAKLAGDVAPALGQAFVFIVKVIGSAISLLSGFVQILTKTISAVNELRNGSNAGIDNLGSDIGKIVDRAGDRVFGKGGFFGDKSVPAAQPYGPPAPPGMKVDKVEQRNDINVTVQGGNTNAETGRAVAGAVRGALPQADLGAALAALSTGAGD